MATFQGLPNSEKSSSRVLKPPGGGHSNIFGEAEQQLTHARPKYDQQNSSNISGALGTTDANVIAEATAREIQAKQAESKGEAPPAPAATNGSAQASDNSSAQANAANKRVPPGGFSQGFW